MGLFCYEQPARQSLDLVDRWPAACGWRGGVSVDRTSATTEGFGGNR